MGKRLKSCKLLYRKFYHKEGRMLNEHAALLFSESVISQPLFACRKIPRAGMSSPENESVEKSNYGKTSRILYFAGL